MKKNATNHDFTLSRKGTELQGRDQTGHGGRKHGGHPNVLRVILSVNFLIVLLMKKTHVYYYPAH